MKKIALIATIVVAALSLNSCGTQKSYSHVVPVDAAIISYSVADLNPAGERVSKTIKWNWNPFKIHKMDAEIENATAQLLLETGSDVLIDRHVITEKRGFMRGGSVTVVGRPAKIKNLHAATQEDANVVTTLNPVTKKAAKRKKFLGIF